MGKKTNHRVWLVFTRVRKGIEQILLVKRGPDCGNPGKWGFIGGGVDAGEDFDDAVVRECLEETGFALESNKVTHAFDATVGKRIMHYYQSDVEVDIQCDLKPTEESVAYEWFDIGGITESKLAVADGLHFSVTDYLAYMD